MLCELLSLGSLLYRRAGEEVFGMRNRLSLILNFANAVVSGSSSSIVGVRDTRQYMDAARFRRADNIGTACLTTICMFRDV